MSWNEPGNHKDPWGNNHTQTDVDEVIRRIQQHLRTFFGKKPGTSGGGFNVLWILPLVIIVWLLSGVYRVDSAERAVVLRFGAYVETTGPGLHWHWPWPMASAHAVNIGKVRSFRSSHEMLTADENIVQVAIAVQYLVDNPYQYLFGVKQPGRTLGEVGEAAIRQVVGGNKMDFVLGKGQSKIAAKTKALMQSVLERYDAGLKVLSVNLQEDRPPREVQDAFDDVNKAREDEQRLQNEARAYANTVVPKAKGQSARIIQGAEAYRAKVVADAQGETSRFNAILEQYKKAPRVTRERLYIGTVQSVLEDTNQVLIDPKTKGSLLYVPLDKLFKSGSTTGGSASQEKSP